MNSPVMQAANTLCEFTAAANEIGGILGLLMIATLVMFAFFGWAWFHCWEFTRQQPEREAEFLEAMIRERVR